MTEVIYVRQEIEKRQRKAIMKLFTLLTSHLKSIILMLVYGINLNKKHVIGQKSIIPYMLLQEAF